jgi:hydrophobe/amphiphile efflux-1 (HAE1) family protein
MKFPHFFIDRPIFAAVLSVLIVIMGVVAYPGLPVAQYPEIAPPTVIVTATYPGATPETLAETVAAPLEEAINGVENMIYMQSSSTSDGSVSITVTFKQGADVNQSQVLVQNRVSTAEPRLPEEVRTIGVTVRKNSPDILMVINLTSPDHSLPIQYISNYAVLQLIDRLSRIQGVGGIRVLGARDYNMRIWIDPGRAAARNLTVSEIVTSIRGQNAQVAAGSVGAPPFSDSGSAFPLSIQVKGRLSSPEEFGNIVLKSEDGKLTRVRDIARIELGAQDYAITGYLNGEPALGLGVTQLPGSNALTTANAVKAAMAEAEKTFPPGLKYQIPYNPTEYIEASITAVEHTLVEAIVLVALVVLLFLQSWRAAIIPIVAIPISLVASFAAMAAFGFSLNNLSLFGLVLAIGIVVDDAIVVVENVERLMEQRGMSPREAAHETMDEVSGALIAIALVLCGVFVPTAFIPGISGQFYKQFALTIVTATAVSAFVSLTLSPALAALVLKPPRHGDPPAGWRGLPGRFARGFNRGFDKLSHRYGRLTARLVRMLAIVGIAYVVLVAAAGWRFYATPTGFIPAQDQGYLIGVAQLPPGSSLSRTNDVVREAGVIAKKNASVESILQIAGLDGATFSLASNAGTFFITLKPHADRKGTADEIAGQLRKDLSSITSGNILIIPPPPVRGIGTGGGWKMMVEDRNGQGLQALEEVTNRMVAAAHAEAGLTAVFTGFNTKTPRLDANIDRLRAEQLGVPVEAVFATLNTYLGSTYVNDFNYLGRTFRVTAQADAPYRDGVSDVNELKTRSASGAMVPMGAVMNVSDSSGPQRVVRYNLYPASELQGDTTRGFSSGQSLRTMEQIAAKTLPAGFSFDWTELAFQQKQAGNTAILVFGLAVVFVFLLLAAQYESLVLPLAVILIVPMCLLAAIVGVNIMGRDNNILTQIGLVVLVGLAAKNAILIVEFARQGEEEGLGTHEAAEQAAHQRLRPILMTSIAFILGVLPLVIGTGPGAEMRSALGIAVFFGMIGVTVFGLLFTPAFYVITRTAGDRAAAWKNRRWPPHPEKPKAVEPPKPAEGEPA